MVLAATTFEVVLAVLIPLISAFIGAVSGALVARHIRRAQLNAEAAVRIESYVVEANDAITAVKGDDPFDVEPFNRALNLLEKLASTVSGSTHPNSTAAWMALKVLQRTSSSTKTSPACPI